MITQRHIAETLGLSQGAVSLALRGHASVSKDTIRKVRSAARKLGYRPDPLISALMAQRQGRGERRFQAKIAFLTAFAERDEWRRSHYAAGCFVGARDAAAARGYLCEPVWLHEPKIRGRRLSQILWTQNVQGLILAPLPVENPPVDLEWERFAAVSLDFSMANPVLHRVVDDHAFGMERVLREVARRRYRRPGLVIRASQDVRTHHSRLGVFLVQRRLNSEWADVPPLILPEDRFDARLFTQWVKREKPDVVLTEEAEVMPTVAALGVRVPRELGIAFFHTERPGVRLSGLEVDSRQVGRMAASILMRLIETNERGEPVVPTTSLVNSFTWHHGRTLRPPVDC